MPDDPVIKADRPSMLNRDGAPVPLSPTMSFAIID
jgi:hypothetical protein